MQTFPPPLRARVAAALVLAGATMHAVAAPGLATTDSTDAPVLSETTFMVHNRLQTTLHGFRIRTGYRSWVDVGDLAPGDSEFTVPSPIDADPGTFEFRRDGPAGRGDYVLGAYARMEGAPVIIDVDVQPATVDGRPVPSEQGSFALATVAGSSLPAQDRRLPLIAVPVEQAGDSEFMICGGIGPGLSFIGCRSASLNFSSLGYGVNLGIALGYFWSPLSPQDLAAQFPVTIYTAQPLVGAYFKFLGKLTPGAQDDWQKVGQFVGLGPSIGAALNWGGFDWRPRFADGPMGSYRDSCSDIAYDSEAQQLSAQCQTHSGARVHSTLSVASCFGSDAANDGGVLRCEMPAGSYPQSCGPIRYRDGVLQALCTRNDGTTRVRSTLDFVHECGRDSSVSDVDGRLTCDQPWIPPGPYLGSCRGIRYADGVLQADCGSVDTLARGLRLAYTRECKPRSDVGFSPAYARPGHLYCVDPRS